MFLIRSDFDVAASLDDEAFARTLLIAEGDLMNRCFQVARVGQGDDLLQSRISIRI